MCVTARSSNTSPLSSSSSDGNTTATSRTKEVLIAGAGPAGLLSAILLLKRNEERANADGSPLYKITLVDPSPENYGKLTLADLARHRSWMIGLSGRGLKAIRGIPGLFENYIANVGTELQSTSIHLGKKEIKVGVKDFGGESQIVDRNHIVAGLARYVEEHYGDKTEWLTSLYGTRVQFVDGERKRALVRPTTDAQGATTTSTNVKFTHTNLDEGAINSNNNNNNGPTPPFSDALVAATSQEERYLSYDILLGCDGIRSVARDAIMHAHRDFAFDIQDIFSTFKAVHIDMPKWSDPQSIHILTQAIPSMNGIALPEQDGKVNLAFGYYFHDPAEDVLLHSTDVDEVAAYVKKHLINYPIEDYHDFARQWIGQKWNTTGMVHCNFYHSNKVNVLLMGDAAHATSPAIGQGMNTALEDASVLGRLLDEHGDDAWCDVLTQFSAERVKEGNALTDLSYLAYCFDPKQMMRMQLKGVLRMVGHKVLPWLVEEDPMAKVGRGESLATAYGAMCRLNMVQPVRYTNDVIRRRHFEEENGMVKKKREEPTWGLGSTVMVTVAVLGAVSAMTMMRK